MTSWRVAFLKASLGWALCLSFGTEFLSFFHFLTYRNIASFWGLILAFELSLVRYSKLKAEISSLKISFSTAFFCFSFLLFLTFLVAIISPPNTWDSMTYHMGRVEHWLVNQSIESYPTHLHANFSLAP